MINKILHRTLIIRKQCFLRATFLCIFEYLPLARVIRCLKSYILLWQVWTISSLRDLYHFLFVCILSYYLITSKYKFFNPFCLHIAVLMKIHHQNCWALVVKIMLAFTHHKDNRNLLVYNVENIQKVEHIIAYILYGVYRCYLHCKSCRHPVNRKQP